MYVLCDAPFMRVYAMYVRNVCVYVGGRSDEHGMPHGYRKAGDEDGLPTYQIGKQAVVSMAAVARARSYRYRHPTSSQP